MHIKFQTANLGIISKIIILIIQFFVHAKKIAYLRRRKINIIIRMNQIRNLSLALVLLGILSSFCSKDNQAAPPSPPAQKSIVILYENDVHGAVKGYPVIAGLRDAIAQSDTAWAAVVSSGDYFSGDALCTLGTGKYIAKLMGSVGYDAVTLGNHEFDFGALRLFELIPALNTPVICANFFDCADNRQILSSYIIRNYGDKRVAFVGVVTPETMSDERYAFYDSDFKKIYDLRTDKVYDLVQTAVNQARGEGADYVVVISHLSELPSETNVNSVGLVESTNGIDVVLDGHSHSVVEALYVQNKDGKFIPITQTGTKFANIGKLLIKDGNVKTELIPLADCHYSSPAVSAVLDEVNKETGAILNKVIGITDFDLIDVDANGQWLCRSHETNMGDLITDIILEAFPADIALVNGGGIRANIPAGIITYGLSVSTFPFINYICNIEATGAQLLIMLHESTKRLPALDGSFPHVSGMKYTIHTGSHTVSDVQIYNRTISAYEPIDPVKTYTVSTIDYYRGGGFYDTLLDCKLLKMSNMLLFDKFVEYIQQHHTIDEKYRTSQGRITILDD